MWRLGVAWEGFVSFFPSLASHAETMGEAEHQRTLLECSSKCIYQGQMIHFADCIVAEVKSIYRRKKRVRLSSLFALALLLKEELGTNTYAS
jgi:hypothetical protein